MAGFPLNLEAFFFIVAGFPLGIPIFPYGRVSVKLKDFFFIVAGRVGHRVLFRSVHSVL